jgi:hypothetical protein
MLAEAKQYIAEVGQSHHHDFAGIGLQNVANIDMLFPLSVEICFSFYNSAPLLIKNWSSCNRPARPGKIGIQSCYIILEAGNHLSIHHEGNHKMSIEYPAGIKKLLKKGDKSAEAFELSKIKRWNEAVMHYASGWVSIQNLARENLPPEVSEYFFITSEIDLPCPKDPDSAEDRKSLTLHEIEKWEKPPIVVLNGHKGVLKIPEMDDIGVSFNTTKEMNARNKYLERTEIRYYLLHDPDFETDGSLEMVMHYARARFIEFETWQESRRGPQE